MPTTKTITLKTAMERLGSNPRAPHSYLGLQQALERAGAIVVKEKFYGRIIVHETVFNKWVEALKKITVRQLAEELSVPRSKVQYAMLKCGIELKSKLGIRYLDENDVKKLNTYFKGKTNGKRKEK